MRSRGAFDLQLGPQIGAREVAAVPHAPSFQEVHQVAERKRPERLDHTQTAGFGERLLEIVVRLRDADHACVGAVRLHANLDRGVLSAECPDEPQGVIVGVQQPLAADLTVGCVAAPEGKCARIDKNIRYVKHTFVNSLSSGPACSVNPCKSARSPPAPAEQPVHRVPPAVQLRTSRHGDPVAFVADGVEHRAGGSLLDGQPVKARGVLHVDGGPPVGPVADVAGDAPPRHAPSGAAWRGRSERPFRGSQRSLHVGDAGRDGPGGDEFVAFGRDSSGPDERSARAHQGLAGRGEAGGKRLDGPGIGLRRSLAHAGHDDGQ